MPTQQETPNTLPSSTSAVEDVKPYDSTEDTQAHIDRVNCLLMGCCDELYRRGTVHDASKLVEPEKSGFDSCVPKLKNLTYGSDEYRAALREIKPTLEHHYANNSHHPEFFPKLEGMAELLPVAAHLRSENFLTHAMAAAALEAYHQHLTASVNGMNLFDVIEMLMDWKAATERMKDGGDIAKSIEHNIGRFALSPQVGNFLRNTARSLGWIK